MTLIEVLIVVSILSLIAAAVTVAAFGHWGFSQKSTATTSARVVRKAVESNWLLHGGSECPSVDQLVASGVLDEDSPRADPWGKGWQIECDGNRVTVSSAGPDREFGTSDDIRVPPKRG